MKANENEYKLKVNNITRSVRGKKPGRRAGDRLPEPVGYQDAIGACLAQQGARGSGRGAKLAWWILPRWAGRLLALVIILLLAWRAEQAIAPTIRAHAEQIQTLAAR